MKEATVADVKVGLVYSSANGVYIWLVLDVIWNDNILTMLELTLDGDRIDKPGNASKQVWVGKWFNSAGYVILEEGT